MEAVAAAAGIAGIVTLVFQCIDGLNRFKELFSDASSASGIISRLLDDINSLISVLENVREILEKYDAQKKEKNFASLDIKVSDCSKDIQIWLSTARLLRPSAEHGGKAWLMKFRLAVNKDAIQTIRDEIGRHRQIINLSLSVLGRSVDLDTSKQVHRIGGSLSQTVLNHGAQEAMLHRIENYSRASLQSSAHSIRSMNNIRNELSRLEAMISASSRSTNIEVAPGDSSIEDRAERPPREDISWDEGSSQRVRSRSSSSDTISHEPKARAFLPRTAPFGSDTSTLHWPSASSSKIKYESSFLYASFSAVASTKSVATSENKESEIDPIAVQNLLRQTTLESYPSCVADYICLHNLHILCSTQIRLLSHAHRAVFHGATHRRSQKERVDKFTHSLTLLSSQMERLQRALNVARQHCIRAGHSLSAVDELLPSASMTHQASHSDQALIDSDDEDWKDASET